MLRGRFNLEISYWERIICIWFVFILDWMDLNRLVFFPLLEITVNEGHPECFYKGNTRHRVIFKVHTHQQAESEVEKLILWDFPFY